MKKDYESFNEAINPISHELKNRLVLLADGLKEQTYEIRLRANRPVMLFGAYGNAFFSRDAILSSSKQADTYICSAFELNDSFGRICGYSMHTHQKNIADGFVTMKGGHRAGVAGTASINSDGEIIGIRDVSSLNIRIAREVRECSSELIKRFYSNGEAGSLIIAGPPSSGKTTVLRDLIRKISSGDGTKCLKVAAVDEREELAAVSSGLPTRDIGFACDILDGYPKSKAILLAVRTLSPQIIACDEVGAESEVEAIRQGVNTGVKFIVTVHASSFEELVSRPQIERLLETYSFNSVVLLSENEPCKIKNVFETGELRDEIYRRRGCASGGESCGISDLHTA